jgi:predicted O-methyltransferase YrrM
MTTLEPTVSPEGAEGVPATPGGPEGGPEGGSGGIPSFAEVLGRYASGHNETGTDKTTTHAYGPLYAALFDPLRESARRVMELGVYSGASVLALAEHFVNARVLGVDVTLSRVRFGEEGTTANPRVSYLQYDATLPDAARVIGGDPRVHDGYRTPAWDVILDDASHRKADQLQSFRTLAPLLRRPGGLYVIEDILGDADLDAFRAALDAARVALGFATLEWHDLRHVSGCPDDIVAVVRA